MRILLIAPATDLAMAAAEVAEVASTPGLTVRQMQGDVSRSDLVREAMRTGARYECLWFATHGSRAGVLMSDGMLSISALVPLVLSIGARLVVLNSCDSAEVAQSLARDAGADVIATIAAVPDDTAFQTGAYLAAWLVRTNGDALEAFHQARPGGYNEYQFFHGARSRTDRGEQVSGDQDQRDNERQDTQIAELVRLVIDLRLGHTELRTTISNIQMAMAIMALFIAALIVGLFFLVRMGALA